MPVTSAVSRLIEHGESDLAHFLFAHLDMRAQQSLRFLDPPSLDSGKYSGMLLVRRRDAIALREVEPADDADTFGDLAVRAHHLGIAGTLDDSRME